MKYVDTMVEVFRQHGDHLQREYINTLDPSDPMAFESIKSICLGNYTPSVQRWAVEALGVFGRDKGLPMLLRSLKSQYMSVRLHAILGIGTMGDKSLARYIRPLMQDPSGGIRVNALALIAELKPRWMKEVAEAALSDEKDYVRKLSEKILCRQTP